MKKRFPPSDEQIAEAAYHLWLKANSPQGRDQEFWYEAETQLNKPAPRKRAPAKKPAVKATATKTAAKKPAARKPAAKKPAAKRGKTT